MNHWPHVADRLLELLSINRHRLRALALPAIRSGGGANLHQRREALLQLEVVYPLLVATARHLQAQAALAAAHPAKAIRTDLAKAYDAKVAHDRRHLSRRWAELINEAKPRAAQLQTLIPLRPHGRRHRRHRRHRRYRSAA